MFNSCWWTLFPRICQITFWHFWNCVSMCSTMSSEHSSTIWKYKSFWCLPNTCLIISLVLLLPLILRLWEIMHDHCLFPFSRIFKTYIFCYCISPHLLFSRQTHNLLFNICPYRRQPVSLVILFSLFVFLLVLVRPFHDVGMRIACSRKDKGVQRFSRLAWWFFLFFSLYLFL